MSSLFGIGGAGNVGGGDFYSTTIDQSLRFNDNDSAYLSWTPASAGNRKTWTWSCWVKRSSIDSTNAYILFDASTSDTAAALIEFGKSTEGDNSLNVVSYQGAHNIRLRTSMRFRDVSSWYHIVVAMDTSQATASDRVNIYVNGTLQTDFQIETYPAQNHEPYFNSTNQHHISKWWDSRRFFDGYMAEVNFIDGTALDASSFGETSNGIWVPKAYSGSYGTNGFYLSFADSGAIGDDLSGNTNDWTANNLAAHDVVPDSPTNNFATNNGAMRANITQSEGNLKMVGVGNNYDNMGSTFTFDVEDADGWYWEYRSIGNDTATTIGISTPQNVEFNQSDATHPFSNTTACVSYNGDGQKKIAGTNSSYGDSWTAGDIIGIAVKSGAVYFYKNGTIQNSGTAAATGLTGDYVAAYAINGTQSGTANYGQDSTFAGVTTAGGNSDANGYGDFKYSVPSGYKSLCSANLPEPAIGPNSTTQADDYFNTAIWSGNSTDGRDIVTGHATDFVWIKSRSNATNHYLFDSIRGVNNQLLSNATSAEATISSNRMTAFNSDGFEVGAFDETNGTGKTFVGWSWKAGGTAVSNTDGSITSQVSANTDAGFSIVGFTSTGNTETVGHGLSQAPELYIRKSRSNTENWVNFFTVVDGTLDFMNFNTTNAASGSGASLPTSTVFSIGGGETNGETHIAYCFHSSDVCKVGSYVGNGSQDGTFVYTGHRVRWLMVKRSDSTGAWTILDNKRDPFNEVDTILNADATTAESSFGTTNRNVDFLSNGFKIRYTAAGGLTDLNASGGNYIYLAFAEAPFKYANAR